MKRFMIICLALFLVVALFTDVYAKGLENISTDISGEQEVVSVKVESEVSESETLELTGDKTSGTYTTEVSASEDCAIDALPLGTVLLCLSPVYYLTN